MHQANESAIHGGSGPTPTLFGRRAAGTPAPDGPHAAAGSSVYAALAAHQGGERWFGRDFLACLNAWAERFNVEFKLDVPEVALRVDALSRRCYGHFRYGHNGFGLRGEIAINARYVESREAWEVLGTLLHELLHGWQQAHGTPGKGNYHNRQFRDKARSCGLVVDEQGVTTYVGDSPFFRLLAGHGVAVPLLDTPPAPARARGESKMKKWSCGCTNVRCAVGLHAWCTACGRRFERAG